MIVFFDTGVFRKTSLPLMTFMAENITSDFVNKTKLAPTMSVHFVEHVSLLSSLPAQNRVPLNKLSW